MSDEVDVCGNIVSNGWRWLMTESDHLILSATEVPVSHRWMKIDD